MVSDLFLEYDLWLLYLHVLYGHKWKFLSLSRRLVIFVSRAASLAHFGKCFLQIEGKKKDFMEDYEVMVPFQSSKPLNAMLMLFAPRRKPVRNAPRLCMTLKAELQNILPWDDAVIKLVKEFMESRKPLASICHGQQILSAAGVLKDKKCTAYPAVKLNVVLGGGTWLEPEPEPEPIDRCFTDRHLVTGAAWPGHPEFISQFMALLGVHVKF